MICRYNKKEAIQFYCARNSLFKNKFYLWGNKGKDELYPPFNFQKGFQFVYREYKSELKKKCFQSSPCPK